MATEVRILSDDQMGTLVNASLTGLTREEGRALSACLDGGAREDFLLGGLCWRVPATRPWLPYAQLTFQGYTVTVMKQNPVASSQWARLAASGFVVYQVWWTSAKQPKRQWLGIFVNGLYRPYPCQWPRSWAS